MTPKAYPDPVSTGNFAPGVRRAFPSTARIDMWTAADGWKLRRYFQPGMLGKARGSLLFLTGRGDFLEKYSETLDAFAAAGWNVTAIDWRGQGESGRLCASDPVVGDCESFGPWIDDLAMFHREWASEGAGPHVVVAHSMGGHLLLRAMIEGWVKPDAAVLVAPMLGLNSAPFPEWIARRIAGFMAHTPLGVRAAWRDVSKSPRRLADRRARLTHSIGRHDDELWWRTHRPDLALSGPSWRWLDEAYRSIDLVRAAPGLDKVDVPVLVVAARHDRLVSARATAEIAAKLPDAAVHFYGPEAAHEILRESDDVRDDALARILRFLDQRAPAR